MASRKKLGSEGEKAAVEYLQECGYRILEQNFRWSRAEVDIISIKNDLLVVVEVKSRTYSDHSATENAPSAKQWDRIADATGNYMEVNSLDCEVRFDTIVVQFFTHGEHALKHYEDVFFPGRF